MRTPEEYTDLISRLPKCPIDTRLTRLVPFFSFDAGMPRQFLYTSGRPNRCNPKGINCIYFSETDETTHAEWEEMNTDINQPMLTFHGRLKAGNIIDLANEDTFGALGLTGDDLLGNFRLRHLNLQTVGEAVSRQTDAVAIRYPSRAMTIRGKVGYNLAIFPDAIVAPNVLEIYGENDTVIESWPPTV